MMLGLPDGTPQEFTQGPKDGSPHFSPDGTTLAFLRPDDKDQRQLWMIPTSGGEAKQLTTEVGGALEFSWSPDSTQIVFVSDVDPNRPPPDHDEKKDPQVRIVRRINHRMDTIGWRGDAHRHLFVVNVGDGVVRQLTEGDWDDFSPLWSPDGSRIAFLSSRRTDRDITFGQNEVYTIPADGGETTMWSGGLSSIGALGWSSNGRRLVVAASNVPKGNAWMQAWLYLLDPKKEPLRLTDDSIKPNGGFPPFFTGPTLFWNGDEQIIFLGDTRGETFLFQLPAGGGEPHRLTGGGVQIADLSLDAKGGHAALTATSPESPGDLYLVDVGSATKVRLTFYNDDYLREHIPGRMEKFNTKRGDQDIECRLVFPPDFDASCDYPLILDIHGGPHSAFFDSFSPTHQVLASAGYIVLAVNPRGSASYGNEFVMRVINDWGGEDYLDLMATVDEVSSRPYVDSSRIGVHGYSYGGYMSSWIVGQTDVFKAAVVGAPVTDLNSMYGTSDIGVGFGEIEWGGNPVEGYENARDRSPLTYAPQVNTPVLLLHGESDLRCPLSQSEQYFTALKRLGKEVELVRFPGCNHLFTRMGHPKLREQYLERTLGWFNRHMGEE
jgi:dipeptidyl aminopeptidase/acylaminoacyl peptidase